MNLYHITENGFSTSDDKVSCPECKIKAESYLDAIYKLHDFLATKEITPDIELITPLNRIDFEQ